MKRTAYLISSIFHPIVLFDVGILFLIGENFSWMIGKIIVWSGVLCIINLIMIAFIIWGMRTKRFSNFDVSKRKQRFLLYQIVIIFCVAFYFIGRFVGVSDFVLKISVVFLIFLVMLELINTKIKASVHIASITIVSISAALFYGGFFLLAPVAIPLTAWARIYEKRHTPKEVVVGFCVGLLILGIAKLIIQ